MARGGKRPGAGRKKGYKEKATLERDLTLERIRQRVFAATDEIVNGQITTARGVSYLYRIDKDEKGKNKRPELVTSQQEIEDYLAGDYEGDPDTYYYITTEKPETAAARELWDRAFGKAVQPHAGGDGKGPIEVTVVKYAHGDNATA